jgi:hypothetical protein
MAIFISASLNAPRLRVTSPLVLGGAIIPGGGGAIIPGELGFIDFPRVTAQAGQTTVTVGDRLFVRSTGATTVNDYQLTQLSFGGAGSLNGVYTSSNPGVATVDPHGFVTHVAPGSATFTFTAGGASAQRTLPFTSTGGSTTDIFQSLVTGSLAAHVASTIDGLLAGKSASNALRIFTTQDHANQVYVRNPNVWAHALPHCLTCLSPWNSTGGNTRAGTLISPRHIIFAAHYQINVGATVRFVAMDGTVVNRTMTAKLTHPSYVPYFPDITVGVLDSDVPESIAFARILPADWADYLPSQNTFNDGRLPTLTLDQEEKALVTDWYREAAMTSFITPSDPQRLAFYESKIGGDSGNPAILPVNGLPVILTVWTYGGAGSGSSIREQKTAINTMMTTLGGGYQLTEIDLSGFTNFA